MAKRRRTVFLSLIYVSLLYVLLLFISSPPSTESHYLSFPSNIPIIFPPPPRIAYFISGTHSDGPRIFRLLQATYHPRNHYLLHLDTLASVEQREELARMVGSVQVFVAAANVNVVRKADSVREEGSTPLALVLHGAAILLRASRDWDWFVNLDSSDYPLVPQDDFLHILSFVPRHFNFIEHTSNTSWTEQLRIMEVSVDPGIYLMSKGRMFTGNKKRTLPDAYKLFTGSPHVILSRKLVEFAILGWDNLPRRLLMFFSNTKYSNRDYFQTLACNTKEFSSTVVNSNLRYPSANSPAVEEPRDLDKMLRSGTSFAGNFRSNDPVLDRIDRLVLHRNPKMLLPGGWCLGRRGKGRDPCQLWGDTSILRPSPGSKSLERHILEITTNEALELNQCRLPSVSDAVPASVR